MNLFKGEIDINQSMFTGKNAIDVLEAIYKDMNIINDIFETFISSYPSIQLPQEGGKLEYFSLKGRRYKIRTDPKHKRRKYIVTKEGKLSLTVAKQMQKQYLKAKTKPKTKSK